MRTRSINHHLVFIHSIPAEMLSKVVDRLEETYNKRDFPTTDESSPSAGQPTKLAEEDQIYYDNLSAHCECLVDANEWDGVCKFLFLSYMYMLQFSITLFAI